MNLEFQQYIEFAPVPKSSKKQQSRVAAVSNSSLPKINAIVASHLRREMSSVPPSLHRTPHLQPEPLTARNKERLDGLYRPRSTSDMSAAMSKPMSHGLQASDLQARPHSALVYRTLAHSDAGAEIPALPVLDIPSVMKQHSSERRSKNNSPLSPPSLTTNGLINTGMPATHSYVSNTPLPQSRQDFDSGFIDRHSKRDHDSSFIEQPRKRRSGGSHASSLHGIPEDSATGSSSTMAMPMEYFDSEAELMKMENPVAGVPLRLEGDNSEEIQALQHAFEETWTLCNTLAALSSKHRQRIFQQNTNRRGSEKNEEAWKLCWKLCFILYRQRAQQPAKSTSSSSLASDRHATPVQPILDGCRAFCQALFDLRTRAEDTDGVLRVSFELNNHLYNSQDRTLPVEFRERTLQFYITLCHRLMKQRVNSNEETDALLRASWNLAENLFTLRENRREGKSADEDLLGSAVQSTLEMCDVFREGWTRVRPERHTPRPVSTSQFMDGRQASASASVRAAAASASATPAIGPASTPQIGTERGGSRSSTIVGTERDRDRAASYHHTGHAHHQHAHVQRLVSGPVQAAYAPGTPTTIFDDLPMSPESVPARPRQLVMMNSVSQPTSQPQPARDRVGSHPRDEVSTTMGVNGRVSPRENGVGGGGGAPKGFAAGRTANYVAQHAARERESSMERLRSAGGIW